MKTYIYALVDPRTREIFYIGKANQPEKRLTGHLSGSRSSVRKRRVIEAIIAAGLRPEVEIEHAVPENKPKIYLTMAP